MTEHPNNALIAQLRARLSDRAARLLDAAESDTDEDVEDGRERILSLPAEDRQTIFQLLRLYREDARASQEAHEQAVNRYDLMHKTVLDGRCRPRWS